MHPENQLCAFLNYSGVDAWRVIEIQGFVMNSKFNLNNSNRIRLSRTRRISFGFPDPRNLRGFAGPQIS